MLCRGDARGQVLTSSQALKRADRRPAAALFRQTRGLGRPLVHQGWTTNGNFSFVAFVTSCRRRANPFFALSILRLEHHGMTVDAVTQACRWRAIGKDVTKMSAAIGAANFSAHHPVADVAMLCHGIGLHGFEITGPAASGIELRIGNEERLVAGGAAIETFFGAVPIWPGKGALCAVFAQDSVLLGRELFTPLLIGFGNFGRFEIAHQRPLSVGIDIVTMRVH